MTRETGFYIYRGSVGDGAFEEPFLIPSDHGLDWCDWIEYWNERSWEMCIVSELKDGSIWRSLPSDAPPPELLELAEKVREESR